MRSGVLAAALLLVGGLVSGGAPAAPAGAEPSSGDDGLITTAVGDFSRARAMALQPDGEIVLAGTTITGDYSTFALARYDADGTLDSSFGTGGVVATQIGAHSEAWGVALQSDGKIVAAGRSSDAVLGDDFDDDFAVARYTADGALDTGFSVDGVVTTDFGEDNDTAVGVAVRSDGKIVTAGFNKAGTGVALARYNPDGTPDTDFDVDGEMIVDLGVAATGANAMALQADGKIVVVGDVYTGSHLDIVLARFTPDGQLDSAFGGDGVVTAHLGTFDAQAHAVVVQSDQKIVVGGRAVVECVPGPDETCPDGFALARFNADGTPDTGFGASGSVITMVGDEDAVLDALSAQPDGKIVAAGSGKFWYGSGYRQGFALARYQSNGSPDTTFHGTGRLVHTAEGTNSTAHAVAALPDGRVVAGGEFNSGSDHRFALYLGDATAPTNAHVIGLPRYQTTLRPTLRWTAHDTGTGVRDYDVRYRYARYDQATYGGYHTWRSATVATSAMFTGVAGRTYCFAVRARDNAGNVGMWGAESCTAFPVNDRSLIVSGTWKKLSSSAYYLGTACRSSHRGASLRAGAYYRHLALVASSGPGNGTVKVYRGTQLLKTVILKAGAVHHRVLIAIASSTVVKHGTVKIVQASAGKSVTIEGLAVSLA